MRMARFGFFKKRARFRRGGDHPVVARWRRRDEGAHGLSRVPDALKAMHHHERMAAHDAESLRDPRDLLSRIAVIAFVGPSGTGKSTRALDVARRYNIQYLIDDGLLIHGSSIVAGSSAKRASTKMDSVRQAIFLDESRAQTMRRALLDHQPAALMILGTSNDMLLRICHQLWLNPPTILIRIEDVTSEEERENARRTRLSEGRHVIPVPSMEIKHEFSGYVAEPLQKLRRRFDPGQAPYDTARTIVRPTFSTLGRYAMSDDALTMMIKIAVEQTPGVASLVRSAIRTEKYGIVVDVALSLHFGYAAQDVMLACQRAVADQIERYTAINVLATNVRAVRLAPPAQRERVAVNTR